ncbi:hypothetical protein GCM10028805_58290 [Spirosoma harenae]
MKIQLLITALLLLVWGCKPSPVTTELMGYSLHFPINLAELQKQYPNGHTVYSNRFVDSTQAIKVEWWFNVWGDTGNSDPKNEPHGVVMFLKNKEASFDSVKTALEKRYKQTLEPLVFTKSNGNFSKVKPIYVCHISEDALLVLTKADSYSPERNSLEIAIGYNLTKKQLEAFALLSGPIYDDKL